MGLRISNGFISKFSVFEVMDRLRTKRKYYDGIVGTHFLNQILYEAVEIFDAVSYGGKSEIEFDTFDTLIEKTRNLLLKREKDNIFAPDCRLIIGVYPTEEKTLIKPYGSSDLTSHFINVESDWLEPYGFSESTDDLPIEEYNNRRNVWDNVYSDELQLWGTHESMLNYVISNYCHELFYLDALINKFDKDFIKFPTEFSRKKKLFIDAEFKRRREVKADEEAIHLSMEIMREVRDNKWDKEINAIELKDYGDSKYLKKLNLTS